MTNICDYIQRNKKGYKEFLGWFVSLRRCKSPPPAQAHLLMEAHWLESEPPSSAQLCALGPLVKFNLSLSPSLKKILSNNFALGTVTCPMNSTVDKKTPSLAHELMARRLTGTVILIIASISERDAWCAVGAHPGGIQGIRKEPPPRSWT